MKLVVKKKLNVYPEGYNQITGAPLPPTPAWAAALRL